MDHAGVERMNKFRVLDLLIARHGEALGDYGIPHREVRK
jgi:hypothetical protein